MWIKFPASCTNISWAGFRYPAPEGGLHEGLAGLVIQSPGCHGGADARALSWISISFLIHTHLQAEMANLVSGSKCLNLSSPGRLGSDPRTALPVVE